MKLFEKIFLLAFSRPRRNPVLSMLSYVGFAIILIGSISDRVPMSFGQADGGGDVGGNGGDVGGNGGDVGGNGGDVGGNGGDVGGNGGDVGGNGGDVGGNGGDVGGNGGDVGGNGVDISSEKDKTQCELGRHYDADREKCVHDRSEECPDGSHPDGGVCPKCPDGSPRGTDGCICPDGSHPDGGVCPKCPDGSPRGYRRLYLVLMVRPVVLTVVLVLMVRIRMVVFVRSVLMVRPVVLTVVLVLMVRIRMVVFVRSVLMVRPVVDGCTCPDGSHPDGGVCPKCPDGSPRGTDGILS